MCFTAKASIMSFILLLVISVLLWWRNEKYDRVAAALFLAVSLIQLVEYLRHRNNITSEQGGRYIFLILWLQVLVLTVATYIYLKTTLTLILMLIGIGLFIWALFQDADFSMIIGSSGHMEWQKNGTGIVGNMGLVYLAGLFIPLLVIQAAYGWKDVGLWLIMGVLAITCIWAQWAYPGAPFASLWCYTAVAVAFTAWLVGAF